MAKTKHAYVLVKHTNGDTSHLEGAVIRSMPTNQFTDLEGIGFVREATEKELAAVDPKPASKPRTVRNPKKVAAKPAAKTEPVADPKPDPEKATTH